VTHLPAKQVTYRRDPQTKDRVAEVTRYSKYRDVGGVQWPYDIQRERDGEKIYQMYSDSVVVNKDLTDNLFTLPADMKILKKPK
jgi:capsule polysaccharide export protein KpsE/RkpR